MSSPMDRALNITNTLARIREALTEQMDEGTIPEDTQTINALDVAAGYFARVGGGADE